MKYFIVYIYKKTGASHWEYGNGLTNKHPILWLHDIQKRFDERIEKNRKHDNRNYQYDIFHLLWYAPISDDIKIPEEFVDENTFL